MLDEYLDEVKDFLKSQQREAEVVVMPDFFIDRFVSIDISPDQLFNLIMDVVERKGGSIDGISQKEFRGGNAINTAAALTSLGVKVTPIVCTDKLGLQLIKFYAKSPKINLTHIKIVEKPSITTALEFEIDDGKANVMLRDVGSLADFGPQNLNHEDFEAIERADCTCVFNWAGTRKYGTELAKTVFRHVKTRGKGKTYFDPADPTPNKEAAKKMLESVMQTDLVDVLSLNENETVFFASLLKSKAEKPIKGLSLEELAKDSAKLLASHLKARIDLHTTDYSATFTGKKETIVPAFHVPVLRATGAGDAWNAGNIIGTVYGLNDAVRLTLANAVAAYYISNPEGKHPTQKELFRLCDRLKGMWKTKTDKN
ncbi:MAG: carbohydrate kinase family protein [Candidatus Bathyarchaeia archaeon]